MRLLCICGQVQEQMEQLLTGTSSVQWCDCNLKAILQRHGIKPSVPASKSEVTTAMHQEEAGTAPLCREAALGALAARRAVPA